MVVVTDAEISELNEAYLNRKGATNVIAFPMREGDYSDICPQLLGDVVISVDTAQREAEAAGLFFEDRFTQLLIHGILHLVGYDHETNSDDEREMEEKSAALFRRIAEM